MTGIWKGGLALSNATSIGATTSGTSSGTLLPGSASTYTKGAWTQLIASTTTDISWLLITGESVTSFGRAFAVDVGVGASGSEVAFLTNLNFTSVNTLAAQFMFPITIAAGSRIAARMASNTGSDVFYILMTGFQDSYQSAGSGSAVDTYGFSTATNLGTAIDPGGTANTKGAYSQLTAATVADITGIVVIIDGQMTETAGSPGIVQWLVDIAVGAAGSEVVVLPNLYNTSYTAGSTELYCQNQFYVPLSIPSGSRIAARGQCTVAATPDRLLGVTVYGVRL